MPCKKLLLIFVENKLPVPTCLYCFSKFRRGWQKFRPFPSKLSKRGWVRVQESTSKHPLGKWHSMWFVTNKEGWLKYRINLHQTKHWQKLSIGKRGKEYRRKLPLQQVQQNSTGQRKSLAAAEVGLLTSSPKNWTSALPLKWESKSSNYAWDNSTQSKRFGSYFNSLIYLPIFEVQTLTNRTGENAIRLL